MIHFFSVFVALLVLHGATAAAPSADDIKQNVNSAAFESLNDQVTTEFEAMYTYEDIAQKLSHPNLGLIGFAKFFKKMADEEKGHARKIMEYINSRGVRVKGLGSLPKVKVPIMNATGAVRLALEKEIYVNQKLLDVHVKASNGNDPNLQDFLETNFLQEQVESIQELRVMLSRLKSASPAVNLEFFIDQEFRNKL